MPHDCVDWTVRPPTRKVPFLILSRGDDRVYTIVPKDLETLEEVARQEFDLGDVDVKISTCCANLCDGLPARITERAWEHLSPYIGCATVEVLAARALQDQPPQEQPLESEHAAGEPDTGTKGKQPLDAGKRKVPESSLGREADRDREAATSDHEVHDRVPTPENQRQEPSDDEVEVGSPRKARYRRLVLSEDDDEHGESERDHEATASSGVQSCRRHPPVISGSVIKAEGLRDYRPKPDPQAVEQPDKPIKQEKQDTRNEHRSQPQSQPGTTEQPLAESGESHKLMIRVAHRPSKQESKFTTKGTTKVHKVLSSVCKSFGLDVSRATLYLIVPTEDEDGEQENLFPCDTNDSIARAGAERDVESRFLLKIAGEA